MADPIVISYFENSDGSGNAVINKNDVDGTFCRLLYDWKGRIWAFCIVENGANYDLKFMYTGDHGTTWSALTTIQATIENTEVQAVALQTGRVLVFFWKDVAGTATKYRAYTTDSGSAWTVETFTES